MNTFLEKFFDSIKSGAIHTFYHSLSNEQKRVLEQMVFLSHMALMRNMYNSCLAFYEEHFEKLEQHNDEKQN